MSLRNILAPRQQVQTGQGLPLAGGKVFLYIPGTTDFITSYRDSALVTPHSNPVKLSGSGRVNIWISRDCDLRITDRTGAPSAEGNLILEELNANPDALGVEESGGLIQNGSFEDDADADTIPDFWTLVSEAGATNAIDTSESTDGAQSFRFTSSGVGGGSLITTNFFPVNDVDDLRVNFDLRSSLATVRNIVRVEWYDITMVSISNSDIYDSTANPLTFTAKTLAVTPPANARFALLRLIGIDPSVALAGSTFFDRVSVFYPAVVSGIFDNITIQNNEIISTNTNGDINLTPNGTGRVVAKNLSPIDIRLRANINTATPPTTEAILKSYSIYDLDESDLLADIGFPSSDNDLQLRNYMHGGQVILRQENAAGAVKKLFLGDADGPTELYHAGTKTFGTALFGRLNVYSELNSDTDIRQLQLLHLNGLRRAVLGHSLNDILQFKNEIHGGNVEISAENAGGSVRIGFLADPDATTLVRAATDVQLQVLNGAETGLIARANSSLDSYFNNVVVSKTKTPASGGLEIDNQLTGSGFERVLTDPADSVDLQTGSFTGTLTGFTSNPSGTINFAISGNHCTLYNDGVAIASTSNANIMTMTGLPVAVRPLNNTTVNCEVLRDNGINGNSGSCTILTTTIQFLIGDPKSGTGFTASGSKGISAGWSITYALA